MARWLMQNDFKPVIGCAFTFHAQPIPQAGFGGTGHGTVLDFVEEKMLRISWCAAPEDPSGLESTVTFTLAPEGKGTRLFLVHDGFDPDSPYQMVSRRFMGSGWPGVATRIGTVIGEILA